MSLINFDSLCEQIGDSNFVLLGESDHWINEKYAYQLTVIKLLLAKGFNAIGLERGYFEVKFRNQLRQHFKEGQTRTVEGILAGKNLTYGERLSQAENRFYAELHSLQKQFKFEIFGFDVSKFPSFMDEIEKTQSLNPLEKQVLIESRYFCEKAFSNPTLKDLIESYRSREEVMELIVNAYSSMRRRIILLGHNGHFSLSSKDYARIESDKDGKTSRNESWKLLGERIGEKNSSVKVVFYLYGSGSHSAPFCDDQVPCIVDCMPGTYEEFLSHDTENLQIFSSKELVKKCGSLDLVENGIVRIQGDITKMCDYVVYSKTATGL